MTKPWPKVKLGEVVNKAERWEAPASGTTYRQIGVRLWGEGAYERASIDGSETKYKQLNRVVDGDLIVNKIWARNGSVAVVQGTLAGCFASSEFPVFAIRPASLDVRWMHWLTKSREFWAQCDEKARGTSGKNRIRPEQFLAVEIPLPPLEEQRRIVNYLDTLSTKITQARTLRHRSTQEAAVFYAQARDRMFSELRADRKPVGDVFDLVNGRAFKPVEWQDVGRKIIRIQNLKYATVPYNRYAGRVDDKHLVRFGDVLFAWSGQVVSLGAHIWRDDEAILNQHIFNVRARTPMLPGFVREGFNALVDEMKTQVRGLEMFHIRKQELVRLKFPVPPLDEQRRIVAELDALQAKVDALKQLQADTEAELTALQSAALDRAFKGEL